MLRRQWRQPSPAARCAALRREPAPLLLLLGALLAALLLPACTTTSPSPLLSSGDPIPAKFRIDRVRIVKRERRLEAYSGKQLVKVYRVAIGRGGAGPKRYEGDLHTPEGRYRISGRHRSKQFHLFLGLSYPNAADRAAHAKGKRDGSIPKNKSIGGAVGIHGEKQGMRWLPHKWVDWTQGCIALDDDEIEELYRSVVKEAEVVIEP